ncbi:MAG: TolC family protein [Bacteroidetes bacterium]|nr:TolC family protein [Bacteroidota bacterium]MBU1719527.1 TolC family protein [Bacteroidota bacterium]
MKTYLASICLLCALMLIPLLGTTQENSGVKKLTMKEAMSFAVSNNATIKNARLDVDAAKKKIFETTAIGLPQVSGNVDYSMYLNIPTQLMPDFLTPAVVGVNQGYFGLTPIAPLPEEGSKFPVQFGSKHSATWGLTASQLIFNGSYIVGLQTARIYKDLSEQTVEKTENDVKAQVASTCFLILIAKENLRLLDTSIATLEKTAWEIRQIQKTGFGDETDADQMSISVSNMKTLRTSMEQQLGVAYDLLKFQMGMDMATQVELTDPIEEVIALVQYDLISLQQPSVSNYSDYKILETQERMLMMNVKNEKAAFLPTLAGYFSYSKNAQRNDFDFFASGKDWYPSSIIGLNLSIPITGSGSKIMRVQQASISLEKVRNAKEMLSSSFILEVNQIKSSLATAWGKLTSEKSNMEMAKRIYDNKVKTYKEGVGSTMEIHQAQNQYIAAEMNYFSALSEMLSAKVKLDKLMGSL